MKLMEGKKKILFKSLAFSSMSVVIVTLLAKLAAFFQEVIIASYLGTSETADAYYMTNGIMQVFWGFLSLGIVRVFLPEYKKNLIESDIKGETYANKMLTLLLAVSLVLSVLMFVLSTPLVNAFAFGFSPNAKELCKTFVKLRTPQYLFWCAITVISAMLQSNSRFIGSKIHEVSVHIPVILFTIVLFDQWGVYSIVVGVIIGSLFGLISQLPFLKGERHHFYLSFKWKDSRVTDSLKRMPAAFVSAAIIQIQSFIDKVMGSMQPVGAISALSYGGELYNAVSGLLSGALATVAYPRISELSATDNVKRLERYVSDILRILWIMMVPFSMAFIIYAKGITEVVYQRGYFTGTATSLVAAVFAAYCFGLFFASTNQIVSLVFFSYGDTRTPMNAGLIGIVLNIVLNFVFLSIIGTPGLALASSCASVLICVYSIIKCKKYINVFDKNSIAFVLKIVIMSIVACSVSLVPYYYCSFINIWFRLILAAMTGIVVYCILIIKVMPEIKEIISFLFDHH